MRPRRQKPSMFKKRPKRRPNASGTPGTEDPQPKTEVPPADTSADTETGDTGGGLFKTFRVPTPTTKDVTPPTPDAAPPQPKPVSPEKAHTPKPVQPRKIVMQQIIHRIRAKYRNMTDAVPQTEDAWSLLTEDFSESIFINLWPTELTQSRLAIIGGVPADQIHLTLVHVGRLDKTRHEDVARIAAICKRTAKKCSPFSGQIQGLGRFCSVSPQDSDVVYATFTSPKLDSLRARLLRAFDRNDITYTKKYGFTPHLTLAYIPQAAITPIHRIAPFRLRFSRLSLSVGNWKHHYKLEGK